MLGVLTCSLDIVLARLNIKQIEHIKQNISIKAKKTKQPASLNWFITDKLCTLSGFLGFLGGDLLNKITSFLFDVIGTPLSYAIQLLSMVLNKAINYVIDSFSQPLTSIVAIC